MKRAEDDRRKSWAEAVRFATDWLDKNEPTYVEAFAGDLKMGDGSPVVKKGDPCESDWIVVADMGEFCGRRLVLSGAVNPQPMFMFSPIAYYAWSPGRTRPASHDWSKWINQPVLFDCKCERPECPRWAVGRCISLKWQEVDEAWVCQLIAVAMTGQSYPVNANTKNVFPILPKFLPLIGKDK